MAIMNGNDERWLDCHVDKGMFSDEVAVTYPPEGNALSSVFVPASAVRGKPGGKGAVRVRVLNRPGQTLAVLPTTQLDVIAVSAHDVSESA